MIYEELCTLYVVTMYICYRGDQEDLKSLPDINSLRRAIKVRSK